MGFICWKVRIQKQALVSMVMNLGVSWKPDCYKKTMFPAMYLRQRARRVSLLFLCSPGDISHHERDDVRRGAVTSLWDVVPCTTSIFTTIVVNWRWRQRITIARLHGVPSRKPAVFMCLLFRSNCFPTGHFVIIKKRAILGTKFRYSLKYYNWC